MRWLVEQNMVIAARRFMRGEAPLGSHSCACCGDVCAELPLRKAVKASFTDIKGLVLGGEPYICEGCAALLSDKDMRFKAVAFFSPGEKTVLQRPEVLGVIASPPEGPFTLSVPYGFKKHHWLYAGLSGGECAYVGVDDRVVEVRRDLASSPAQAIAAIKELLDAGVSRAEIIAGNYRFTRYAHIPDTLARCEMAITPFRKSGAVRLFVTYTPALEKGADTKMGDEKAVITEDEKVAVNVLAGLARGSAFRSSDGIRFWNGYFLRRVSRYVDLPLHEFVSRVGSDIGCGEADEALGKQMDALTPQNELAAMREIKQKAHLMVALAYTQMKKER